METGNKKGMERKKPYQKRAWVVAHLRPAREREDFPIIYVFSPQRFFALQQIKRNPHPWGTLLDYSLFSSCFHGSSFAFARAGGHVWQIAFPLLLSPRYAALSSLTALARLLPSPPLLHPSSLSPDLSFFYRKNFFHLRWRNFASLRFDRDGSLADGRAIVCFFVRNRERFQASCSFQVK